MNLIWKQNIFFNRKKRYLAAIVEKDFMLADTDDFIFNQTTNDDTSIEHDNVPKMFKMEPNGNVGNKLMIKISDLILLSETWLSPNIR